jgi:hypothetical protein
LSSDEAISDGLGRLSLLASALSMRPLEVASGQPGGPAWTDGAAVYVDATAGAREQLAALAVQASLLVAGSLEPDVVRRLAGRPVLARRYLALEGHRALATIADLLPPSVRSLIDEDLAARACSPAASLAAALGPETVADPPESFGTIRTRQLLAQLRRAEVSAAIGRHAPRGRGDRPLAELDDDDDVGDGPGVSDLFSSPVGGGGPLGWLLQRSLEAVRQLKGGGPPGADAPTHRTRTAAPGGDAAVSTGRAGSLEGGGFVDRGAKYPEWDVHRRRYRQDWCAVQEVEPRRNDGAPPTAPDTRAVRRALARLGLGLERRRRQMQGDDIDIDAAIDARLEAIAGSAPDEAVYLDSLRRRRDLAVFLLLDISGSAAEPGRGGRTVHEQQRAAAAVLAMALHEIGDRVALYAFHSQGRSAVRLSPVKRFDEAFDAAALQRLHGLSPVAYSRLGAAIRHGAAVLKDQGGTPRRLLVVLSDGLAYDHGYEPAYGAADARRALAEARRQGVGCLCLSIGASTDPEALRRVFGSAAHAAMPAPEQLGQVIGPLFRSALRAADVRRRLSLWVERSEWKAASSKRPGGDAKAGMRLTAP